MPLFSRRKPEDTDLYTTQQIGVRSRRLAASWLGDLHLLGITELCVTLAGPDITPSHEDIVQIAQRLALVIWRDAFREKAGVIGYQATIRPRFDALCDEVDQEIERLSLVDWVARVEEVARNGFR